MAPFDLEQHLLAVELEDSLTAAEPRPGTAGRQGCKRMDGRIRGYDLNLQLDARNIAFACTGSLPPFVHMTSATWASVQ